VTGNGLLTEHIHEAIRGSQQPTGHMNNR